MIKKWLSEMFFLMNTQMIKWIYMTHYEKHMN
jgi:hypothetical protein